MWGKLAPDYHPAAVRREPEIRPAAWFANSGPVKHSMRAGQLPIDEQVAHLRAALSRNRTLTEVLSRAATMDLPGWYLVAGCLHQTPLEHRRRLAGRGRHPRL